MKRCKAFAYVVFSTIILDYGNFINCADYNDDSDVSEDESDHLIISDRSKLIPSSEGKNKPNSGKILIDLDIGCNKNTKYVNFSREGLFRLYVAKENYLIRSVKKNNIKIWESFDQIYAKQVKLRGYKEDRKYLAIILEIEDFLLFFKSRIGESWVDITEERHKLSDIKLYSTRGREFVELEKSDYTKGFNGITYGYIFKRGVKCTKIELKDEEIWNNKSNPIFEEIEGVYLGLCTNRFIVINHNGDHKALALKCEKFAKSDEPVELVESERIEVEIDSDSDSESEISKIEKINSEIVEEIDCSQIKLYLTIGELKIQLNAITGYKLEQTKCGYKYSLNDDVNCSEVKVGDESLWKHKKGRYPKSVTCLFDGTVELIFKKKILIFGRINGRWTKEKENKIQQSPEREKQKEPLHIEENDDDDDFDVKLIEDDEEDYFNVNVSDENELKLLVYEPVDQFEMDNPINYRKLDSSEYSLYSNTCDRYDIHEGCKCSKVVCKGKTVWDVHKDVNLKPNSVIHNSYVNEVVIKSGLDVVTYSYTDGEWIKTKTEREITREDREDYGEFKELEIDLDIAKSGLGFEYLIKGNLGTYTPLKGYVIKSVVISGLKLWSSTEPKVYGTMVVRDGTFVFSKVKNFSVITNEGSKHFRLKNKEWVETSRIVTLNLINSKDKYEYRYISINFINTFILNHDFVCNKVCFGDEVIWQTNNPGEYGIKVFLEKIINEPKNVVVECLNGNRICICFDENKWTTELIPMDLNIKDRGSDPRVNFSMGMYRTFIARFNYRFASVSNRKEMIWSVKDKKEYSNFVRMKGFNKNEKFIAVLLENSFVLLHKCGKGMPWSDITNTRYKLWEMKFIQKGGKEIALSDLKPKITSFTFVYHFNEGIKCCKIFYKGSLVWKYSREKDEAYAEQVLVEMDTNILYIILYGGSSRRLSLKEQL